MSSGHPNAGYWFKYRLAVREGDDAGVAAEQMLMAGVTSVRDLAAPAEAMILRRQEADRERSGMPGPTLYVAGPALGEWKPNGYADSGNSRRFKTSQMPEPRTKEAHR